MKEQEINEDNIKSLFVDYKKALLEYGNLSIKEHIQAGNEEIYTFCIQSFPNHHNQIMTSNTTKELNSLTGGKGPQQAAYEGLMGEAYNPAVFKYEYNKPNTFDDVERKIEQLHSTIYDLTDTYSSESYKEGTKEYNHLKKMESLAYKLFLHISVEVLNELDYSPLKKSKNFCAIIASHEFSKEECYHYAQLTIPKERINELFPNFNRTAKDYIDLTTASVEQKVTYMAQYIKDFHLGRIPKGRYYTEDKVFEYKQTLADIENCPHDELLTIIEESINESKPNPNNPEEKYFISLFSKESQLITDLIDVIIDAEIQAVDAQKRLTECFKKVTVGLQPSLKHPSFIHRDLAFAIYSTDRKKFPEPQVDLTTSYLKNITDYLPK